VRRLGVAVALLVAGCPGGAGKPIAPSPEAASATEDPATHFAHLLTELQDDILTSYDRDDPPDIDTGMIVARIGTARIGAGPGDAYLAGDLARAPSRWPLDVEHSTRTEVRSKQLQIHIAADQSAAWMSDELSWRITMCGRVAVVPLRITALYAHDGDRWVPVFEHLSFGWTPSASEVVPPKQIKTEVVSGDLRDELSGVLSRGLLRTPHDPLVVAQDASALVLGAEMADEWHGPQVLLARIPPGRLEDRRVGTVGRNADDATIAYWVGNYSADIAERPGFAARKVGLRETHVFEKRPLAGAGGDKAPRTCARDPRPGAQQQPPPDCRWVLVQSHLSQPITDDDLANKVFGTVLMSPKPLAFDCRDGTLVRVPEAAPRRGAGPATGTP